MIANPESSSFSSFCREYCPHHSEYFLEYVCAQEHCDNYLGFQCQQCRTENAQKHGHECEKTDQHCHKLHIECVKKLKGKIQERIGRLYKTLAEEIEAVSAKLD